MRPIKAKFPWLPASLAAVLLVVFCTAAPAKEEKKKQQELAIVTAAILDSEDGYPIDPESVFFPGERVYLRFEVDGYARGQYDRVTISYRIDSFGPFGERFVMAEMGKFDSELAPQDRDWRPIIRHSPMIPPHAGAGTYKVVLTVTDELAEKQVTREVSIRVGGARVNPEEDLVIRNFTFSRTEGGERLRVPAYRPGDTVFASFYITGYTIGEDNAYEVESSVKLVNEEGEALLEFPGESERGSPFYPRRWLPAKFRLDLDDDIPPGAYTLAVSVQDKLGGRSYQTAETFSVR